MLLLTAYLRRELVRLEQMSDTVILGGEGRGMRERRNTQLLGKCPLRLLRESIFGRGDGPRAEDLQEALRFGRVKDVAKKIGAERERERERDQLKCLRRKVLMVHY